ncbi:MAG: MFS transporter [Bacillota bacterium]|nr:MFS transporter [Bacillota bacterium]
MKQRHIVIFFIISLLQYIAANFAHPITPTLIHDLSLPGYMFGAAFAAMSFTNFLFSPFWGKMKEFISLKLLIALGCIGYGFGQYLFSISTTEIDIIVARCIAGFFVGSIGVNSLIYITESSGREYAGKNLAAFVIIQALGAAGGYLLGGIIGIYSIRATFSAQTLTLFLCGFLYFMFTDESKIRKNTSAALSKREFIREINPLKTFADCRVFMTPYLAILFGVVVVSGIGSNAFDQSFNYFLKAEFALTPIYNGILKAVTGILTLLFVSGISMKIMKKNNINHATARIFFACAFSIVALFFIRDRVLFLITALVFFSFNAVYTPLLQDMIARSANDHNGNMLMGFYNATRSLGMICGALISGFMYDFGAMLPFVLAAACFVLSGVGAFSLGKKIPQSSKDE